MKNSLKRAVVLGMTAITLLTGVPAINAQAADAKPVHSTLQLSGKDDAQKITYKVTLDKTQVTDGRVAVKYDPSVLELKKDTEGIRFDDVDVNKDFAEGDSKGISIAFIENDSKSVKGNLVTLQFEVKKGLDKQDTTVSTVVYGINNEDTKVLGETVLADTVSIGREKLVKPEITGLSQTIIGVNVKWKNDKNADGYTIYRSTSKDGKYTEVATVRGGNSYWDALIKNNTTYYYKVVAFQGNGKDRVYSDYSESVSIKVKKFFGLFS